MYHMHGNGIYRKHKHESIRTQEIVMLTFNINTIKNACLMWFYSDCYLCQDLFIIPLKNKKGSKNLRK